MGQIYIKKKKTVVYVTFKFKWPPGLVWLGFLLTLVTLNPDQEQRLFSAIVPPSK